jgi:asparagine synthase (glutamine-hydrolysing)
MRVDKITMSTSIEARVPYLDHKMVEFSMNVPQSLKIKNNIPKYILKEAVRGLIPDEIIDRKKMGFGAPVSEWLSGPLGDKVASTFRSTKLRQERLIDFDKGLELLSEHRNRGKEYAYPIWSLFNLALWYDRWVARDRPSQSLLPAAGSTCDGEHVLEAHATRTSEAAT